MEPHVHPVAAHDMPWFITAPGGHDVLFTMATLTVLAAVMAFGVIFLTLHSLPERLGHKKLQFEVVAVLGLLSLFTHQHVFWVMALLLALIDLPDFTTPLGRMASALERLGRGENDSPSDAPVPAAAAPSTPGTPVNKLHAKSAGQADPPKLPPEKSENLTEA